MLSTKLKIAIQQLEKKYGGPIDVLVNHEEILMVVHHVAEVPKEESEQYINIQS
jgi:hypothetical protein